MSAKAERRTLFHGARIFNGEGFGADHAVLVEGGIVSAVVPAGEAGADETVDLAGGLLAPGFVDLQVNGGGGVLFAVRCDS